MKNMLTVYRVEQKDTKCGPFNPMSPITFFMDEVFRDILDTHPPVFSDIGKDLCDVPWAMVCGCANLSNLRDWFNYPAVIEALKEHDFVIRAYEMDTTENLIYYGKSGRQLMFMREDANAVTDLPITRLLTKRGKLGG